MVTHISKPYSWIFETADARTEFLDTLIKLFQQYEKHLPILDGFDEVLIAGA